MTTRSLLVAALVIVAGGCSVLIDTDRYQSARDGGNVDPNAPSAPVVRITPEAPVSTDDLVMEIVTESIDPIDAGPVTYEIEWLLDGAGSSVSEATVPAAMTSKGQAWTVRVTPTSADGARTGAAGTATVTIGNLPPAASYVGLADYRPLAGDTIESLTGPVTDPDGDLTRIVYAWLLDGTPIDGEEGPRITLDPTVPAGARISLRVTPRDSDDVDGPAIETGEAIVVENTVRWRQLAPDRYLDRGGYIAYDPPNRRMVLLYRVDDATPTDIRVWEYALEPTGGRWVELHPSGDPMPVPRARPLMDARNRRLLFFEGYDEDAPSSRLFSLDLSVRGGERWSELTPSGDVPPPRVWESIGYDAERQRVIVYGGGTPTGALRDLHMLDVARPGFEAWTQIDIGTSDAFGAAAVVVDEARDRALFLGGFTFGAGGTPTPLNTVYTLDLTNPEEGPVLTAATLPATLFFGTSVVDAPRDRALLALGASSLSGDPSTAMYAIDLETLAATAITPTGPAPTAGFFGIMEPDPYDPSRIVVYPGPPAFDGSGSTPRFDVYAMDAESAEFTAIHRYDVDAPPALEGAIGAGNREDLIFFGGQTDYRATGGVWRLDLRLGWSIMTMSADAVTGRTPAPRHGAVVGEPSFQGISFFGGVDNATPVEPVAWSLSTTSDTTGEWVEHTVAAGSTPAAREGASMFDPQCYRRNVGFFGGRGSATDAGQTWVLDCDPGDPRGCSWVELAFAGSTPPARSYGTIARDDRELVLFGGVSAVDGSLLSDIWSLAPCEVDPTWTSERTGPTAPSGRYGHSMVRSDSGVPVGVTRWVIFGGVTDPFRTATESDEAWLLDHLSGAYSWQRVTVASGPNDSVIDGRSGHLAMWDGDSSSRVPRLVVYGGVTRYFTRSDLWELRFPPAP